MKTDLSFAAFLLLWNRTQNLPTPKIHLKIAGWLEKNWEDGNRRLLLMAFRSCGKSTIVGLFCAWLLWRNPDLRILVLAADLALARKMVRNVKRIIEKHPATKNLRPKAPDQWGSDKFTINRRLELRDPSMLAKGVTTNLTGTRADIIICDDVEVPKTCDTMEKRELLRERLHELDYILTPNGLQLYVGTPHHWYTIYAKDARKDIGENAPFLKAFKRLVLPVLDKLGQSLWPERFSSEMIEAIRLKTGNNHFKSQMLCQPVNISDSRFNFDDLNVYDCELDYREAGGEAILKLDGQRLVSASAWWDPAFGSRNGDQSIVAIVFTDESGRYWLHDLQIIKIDERSSLPEADQQCLKVAEILSNNYVPLIAVENNGLGKFLPGILRKTLGEQVVGCAVKEIASRRPKNIRIQEAFDVVLAAKALNVHAQVLQNGFLRQFQEWTPGNRHGPDDILDAVAGALSLEPVRIKRKFGGRHQGWMSGNLQKQAKTDFKV